MNGPCELNEHLAQVSRQGLSSDQNSKPLCACMVRLQQHPPVTRCGLKRRRCRGADERSQLYGIAGGILCRQYNLGSMTKREEQLQRRDIKAYRGDGEVSVARFEGKMERDAVQELGKGAMLHHHAFRLSRRS